MSSRTYRDYYKIGIMGGMGPTTSAEFYQLIIERFWREQGAKHNFEFPEMLIHNVPSPDNVEAGVDQELLNYMVRSANLLEKAGMDFIVIPCNSAHVHIDALSRKTGIPVLNILEETARAVAATELSNILVLGTKSTLGYGLYPPYLADHGIQSVIPTAEDQELITRLIMTVCDGTTQDTHRKQLIELITRYNAQGVVLGCTELPQILTVDKLPIPGFDSLQILADATYARCIAKSC